MQQSLDLGWDFVPAFLKRGLANVLRDDNIRCIKFAIADDLDFGNRSDFFAHQLED